MERDGQTRYYNYDGLGKTVELTDENQNVTDTYEYTAFGEQIAHTGTTENPLRFNGAHGYYSHSDTNDVYVRERTYEPRVGRWLSVDPLRFIDGINCHEYVGNDPVNRTDPSGTFTIYPPIWLPGVGVPTACSCCCCAERAKFSQCVKWKNGDCGLRGLRAGWVFSADLLTAWIPHSTSGDCTFEWWEKASIGTAVHPNNISTWQNVFRPELLQFKPWRERKRPCLLLNDLNKESIKITDCPTMPVAPKIPARTIRFGYCD